MEKLKRRFIAVKKVYSFSLPYSDGMETVPESPEAMDLNEESLKDQLEKKTNEHERVLKKLSEAEDKLKEYQEATEKAYEEVGQMQNQLQTEQRCLETAVQVAARLYSRNTELKRHSIRQRTIALSRRRQAWKAQYAKKESEEPTPASPVAEKKEEKSEEDAEEEKNMGGEEVNDLDVDNSIDELESIAALDKKSKSDLENALEEVNRLREINQDLLAKQKEMENDEAGNQATITQLQSVIKDKEEELKTLKERVEMESEVRQRAETYAAKMYGKRKASQRRSLLVKSAETGSFDDKLQETIKDLEKISGELEEEKMKRKQEVKNLEDKLQAALAGEENKELENQISLYKIEVEQLKSDKQKLEEKNTCLEEKLKTAREETAPPSVPPPPPPVAPPPPPPPPLSTMPNDKDAAKSVYEIIAERKANRETGAGGAARAKKVSTPVSGYADAMAEMMKRIKMGTALRPSTTTTPQKSANDSDTYASIGDKCNSDEWNSSDDSAAESEYDHIYSQVGTGQKKKAATPKITYTPDIGSAGKWATIGGYGAKQSEGDTNGIFFNWAGLKPANRRTQSAVDDDEDPPKSPSYGFQLRKAPASPRDAPKQDSVKHPKDINPDLKKMLDRRRKGMKEDQNRSEKSDT